MTRLRRALLAAPAALLALVLVASSANATHYCASGTVHDFGRAYVTQDCFPRVSDCERWPQLHVYLETNGFFGLQRGGLSLLFGVSDPCRDSSNPDYLVY